MPDQRQLLADIYGFAFPDSFFAFQEFCNSLPSNMLNEVLGINLEGPFLILNSEETASQRPLLWQSRYYNDPPEFFTLLSGDSDGLHWGYYIDDPLHPTFPVASYYSNDAFEISIVGEDLFDTLRRAIEEHHQGCVDTIEFDLDEAEYYEAKLEQLALLRRTLQQYHTADRTEIGETYLAQYRAGQWREVVAPTRDYMGIVIPPELYRPLGGNDKFQIWNYRPTGEEVQNMEQQALALLEQGYPGAALKLGKDLWVYQRYQAVSYALLERAYTSLDRALLRKMVHVAKAYREDCDTTWQTLKSDSERV
jgi:hypothetical protein